MAHCTALTALATSTSTRSPVSLKMHPGAGDQRFQHLLAPVPTWASECLEPAPPRDAGLEKRRGDVAPADMARRIVHRGHPSRRHVDMRDGERVEPVGARD